MLEKVFTLKLPTELYRKIRDQAHAEGISMAKLIRKILEEALCQQH